jgi:hypothetical protein
VLETVLQVLLREKEREREREKKKERKKEKIEKIRKTCMQMERGEVVPKQHRVRWK